jgi:hypothetical protein
MTRLSTSLHQTNLLSTSFLREKHVVWLLDHHHHASSSSSDDSSFLPRRTCHPDGTWHEFNDIFDECDGTDEESKSTANWYQDLVSRRSQKRYVSSWSTELDAEERARRVVHNTMTFYLEEYSVIVTSGCMLHRSTCFMYTG